jgi:DNA-binding SARP family transcriptional activator
MLEFRTLGSIELHGPDGCSVDAVLRHPKRLALLAYLSASHPPRLHRRDTLVALLWPQLDEAHAHGALRQELYQLRRALGASALEGERTDSIGVSIDQLWCDTRAFEAALAEGRHADAMSLWRGEFLPGLQVDGGAFERWLDEIRNRLLRRAVQATRQLASGSEDAGDVPAAIGWSRRLTELDPYDETGWQKLMMLLDGQGDRAGALRAFELLAELLRSELEAAPSPETQALMRRIRDREGLGGSADERPRAGQPSERDRALLPIVICIEPVENLTGDPQHESLGHRLAGCLMHGIANLDFVEVFTDADAADPAAVVSTALYAHPSGLEVRTRLSAPGEGGKILATAKPFLLDPEEQDGGTDIIVAQVLTLIAAQYHPNIPDLLASGRPVATPSWEAFLEFNLGAEAFGAFRFEEAAARLHRAYEIDRTFLKAAIFSALALAYAGDPAGADALATEAMSGAAFASEYERQFGEWLLADLQGRRPEAYRAAVQVARLTSHTVLQVVAGGEALKMNRPGEALRLIPLKTFGPGVGWWRNWTPAYEVVGAAFHLLRDYRAELETALHGRERFPESLEVVRAEARARAALGEETTVLGLVEDAMTLPPGMVSPADVASAAAQELEAHGCRDAGAAARRAGLEWLQRRDAPTACDRVLLVRLLLEAGDTQAARQRVGALDATDGVASLGLSGLLAAQTGDTAAATHSLDRLRTLRSPYLSGRHLLFATGIHVALGQPELAVETLRRAFAYGLPFSVELHALPMLRPLRGRKDFEGLLRSRG